MNTIKVIVTFSLIICSFGCRNYNKKHSLPVLKETNEPKTQFDDLFDDPYYDSISRITGIAPGSPYWYDPSWEVSYSEAKDTLRYYPREQEDELFTIPSTVRVIDERAFQCNEHLTNITIPKGVEEIGVGAFLWSQELFSVTILGPVQDIPWRAFESCPKLNTIVLPNSVSLIDGLAFADCEKLSQITIHNPVPPRLAFSKPDEDGEIDPEWPFAGVNTKRCVVRVPSGSVQKYRKAQGWCQFKQIKEIL